MPYHVYPIIYHNSEFILSIKETLFMNLCKGQRRCFTRVREIVALRNQMMRQCDVLQNALNADEHSSQRENIETLKNLIENALDTIYSCLSSYQKETEWLFENMDKSDPDTSNKWWEIADQDTNYENTFLSCVSTFLKVKRMVTELTQLYRAFL